MCCRCNRTGQCRGCACVKAGKSCSNCLPSRLGNCSNVSATTNANTDTNTDTANRDVSALSNTSISTISTATASTSPSSSPVGPAVSSSGVASIHDTQNQPSISFSRAPPRNVSPPLSPNLPPFIPMAAPNFVWGDEDSATFCKSIRDAYDEVIHWKRNLFRVPMGNVGKSFVAELARLYNAFSSASTLESVALMGTTILPILLLQQPHKRSKAKEHIICLERRLKVWKDGDLASLVREGRTIQLKLPNLSRVTTENQNRIARRFANLMFKGKTHAALDLLTNSGKGGVLHLDQPVNPNESNSKSVREVIWNKHPPAQTGFFDPSLQGPPPEIHPVIFDSIDASFIRSTALRTSGAAGPSGLDAHAWRRLCTAFKTASNSLCQSLAAVARRLCSSHLDPQALAPFLACRLIALDKCPGVRPIGIGDTARRIITKAVLRILRDDIQDAAGSVQLCAGQISGCEAAVHTVREGFARDDTEAILLVDASNAFNSINRMSALHNIRHLCPSIATILINCYRAPTNLFIEGDTIYSQEGTTQGDPLGMPMYALATVPLIKSLPTSVNQVWYADDAAATGKIADLREWWDEISRLGPSYGYYANGSKTWLVVKKEFQSMATTIFGNTQVNITSEGRPHLGAPVGSSEYVSKFVNDKMQQFSKELKLLSAIAVTQPHAAFAAYTHGLTSKWSYLTRTIPSISDHLKVLDDILSLDFIPTLTGRPPPNDINRRMLALPARLGGLGIGIPSLSSNAAFSASLTVTAPLRQLIHSHDFKYSHQVLADQISAKAEIQRKRRAQATSDANNLRDELTPSLQRAMDLARERGSSSWLTTRPLEEHGFSLHKGAFVDALALRYGWAPSNTPKSCVCGANFTVEHMLSCPRGGFPTIRHNEIRDITANLLSEVCSDVRVEPDLQEVTAEVLSRQTSITTNGARLDIAANGFWGGRFERTFVDVRVFNPNAPSNRNTTIEKCYRKHEMEKKRAYAQRVREIEHSSFTPIVLSASGGFAREATNFYKRLASRLADKWDQPYSLTMSWLRCTISFALLRSAIQCIRGARSSGGHPAVLPVDLVIAEAHLN